PTQGPYLTPSVTTGSAPKSMEPSASRPAGVSVCPEMSVTTSDRSRIVPSVWMIAGFSRPGWPTRASFMGVSSIGGAAARQVEHGAGGETVFLADEPGDHSGGLLHFKETAARNLRQHVVDVGLRHLLEDARA